jgi:cation:H+ antiporter
MKTPVIFFFCSAALYCVASYLLGEFPRWMGFVMLGIFVVYTVLTVRNGLKNPDAAAEEEEEEDAADAKGLVTELVLLAVCAGVIAVLSSLLTGVLMFVAFAVYALLKVRGMRQAAPAGKQLWEELLFLAIGAGVIAVGADFLVEHGQVIALKLGVPETVVALLFVALGTSLPELVTTITSLKKGRASLGVGNVIGANVFNLVLVSGVAVSLAPFEVPCENFLLDTGLNMSLVFEIPVMLGVMVLMTIPALLLKKLGRWQGIALLGIYAAFVVCQFVL